MGIKSLFFKDKEAPKSQETPGSAKSNASYVAPSIGIITDKSEYSGYFDDVMKHENIDGPDYYEFAKSLISSQAPLTEPLKFQTIFEGFKAMGLTVHKLMDSANIYLGHFQTKKQLFATEFDKGKKAKVTDVQSQIASIQHENEDLMKRVEKNNQTMQQLQSQLNENNILLETKRANFEAEYNKAVQQINTNLGKIKLYLNA